MKAATRVTFNTLILYLRLLITIVFSLYTTRLILSSLGVVDYGIYSLIAGVITMLSFVSAAMSTSTQRYLSFYQSEEKQDILKIIFANSLLLHIIFGLLIALILIVISETLCNNFLEMPLGKINEAQKAFRYISLIFFSSFVSIPFLGTLNAHENLSFIAVINILESILKLILAVVLNEVEGNKLMFYVSSLLGISLIITFLLSIYCFLNYKECTVKFKLYVEIITLKKFFSFIGWNLFGSLSSVCKNQGLAVLLNLFFGPIINTTYAIANQISGQLSYFSATILNALNPQIVKSESLGNRERMLRLSMIGSKLSYLLMAFIAIPFIFEMRTILSFWLLKVPDKAEVFCSMILLGMMLNQLTIGLDSAIQASGSIKSYMLVVGAVKLLILPISFFLLKLNFDAVSVLITFTLIEGIAGCFRLFISKRVVSLNVHHYLITVIRPVMITTIITCLIDFSIISLFTMEYRFLLTVSTSATCFVILAYCFSLHDDERHYIDNIIKKIYINAKVLKFSKSTFVS